MPNTENPNQFMFYSSKDGTSKIQVVVEDENVWATQKSMSEIFGVQRPAITKHLQNIFESGELEENMVCSILEQPTAHGAIKGKTQLTKTKIYNLDAIISVGYRVNSHKATQFRIWATGILKEYLIKGFAMDDERLKQGKSLFGKDYFDELLDRIREIRASERRFYQKVTDLYQQCSYDYDKNSPITKNFFANAQNKLEYAIVGMTAAEILKARADHNLPNMGLTTWSNQKAGGKILKKDIAIAKNYLTKSEIDELNLLVSMFLDYSENLAKKGKKMSMNDWADKLDVFLEFNEYQVLQNFGSVKKKTADSLALIEYDKFRPIQDREYKSDFDKTIEVISKTGKLPSH